MTKQFKIDNFAIKENGKIFFIAEIGVNHNGNIKLAKKLILEAKKAGADCVKFQTFEPELLVNKHSPKAPYQLKNTRKNQSQIEMLKKITFQKKDHLEIINFCKKKKIMFLSTPYNIEDVDYLEKIGVNAFKLSSMHLTEKKFIEYVCSKNKPVIISTGMSNFSEVNASVKILKKKLRNKFILMQCTTNYPSLEEDTNLNVLKTFKKKFKCFIGYSDHTMSNLSSIISVAFGVVAVEKHFTLSKRMKGPDHKCSLEPHELKQLINDLRLARLTLGSSKKKMSKAERVNSRFMKRSIYLRENITKGDRISFNDLQFKRPLNGIPASKAERVIGRIAKKNLKKNNLLFYNDFG